MEEILNMEIGQGKDWKIGLSTRLIERTGLNTYLIHDTSCGWMIATVDRITLEQLLKGEKHLLDLEWI